MKSFRLVVHQKNFSGEDLIINAKDYAGIKVGDIVEIYHPPPPPDDDNNNQKIKKVKCDNNEEEYPRLLLQVKTLQDDTMQQNPLQKDTISVEQSIAQAFGLQTYKNVTIRIVDPPDISLDSIELTFKDQYMGRSEMWRLKNSLINTCVYMKKILEFCGGAVRCQVYEMWSQGDRVACGVIKEDTKIVFRSSTAMVYIFLQMSSEMWDFDIYGDLYFEKAVNGFLADLFMKWKKHGSNHEVTIVLFSRTFYQANNLEEFPIHMRECLQKDYKGRYYEDFYRVAVQNERYDDWNGILVQLRRIFSEYLKIVLAYHKRDGYTIPSATNSTAAQGNFLEVLNISLNVFEKHYLDRSFERTGQLSVVVTPGVGVFEVDRELTNITKQRIIDNGVGSDLVCVGEQPLHAVPLLKFHNKDSYANVPDDYSMPHWINLSFYSTNKKIGYSNFVPRIKLPPITIATTTTTTTAQSSYIKKDLINQTTTTTTTKLVNQDEYIHNSFFDYDAYDAQIFQLPSVHTTSDTSIHRVLPRYKRSSGSLLDSQELIKGQRRKMSDPDLTQRIVDTNLNARSEPIAIPPAVISPIVSPHTDGDKELSPPVRMVAGSEGSPPLESRALINPFDPSHVTIKLTSNRRRWTHIFPKGPTGVLIQQHHYQAIPATTQSDLSYNTDKHFNEHSKLKRTLSTNQQAGKSFCATTALHEYCKKRPNNQNISHNIPQYPKNPSKSLTLLWGATGEQEWTPALTTGVDWKSLTIPACLPITTDYFPDKRALNIDYVVSLYSLLPDSVNADFAQQRSIYYKKPLTTVEVFNELISQRLAQGFQLILMNHNLEKTLNSACNLNPKMKGLIIGRNISSNNNNTCSSSNNNNNNNNNSNNTENDEISYYLSIGRLFHKISLSGNTIFVTRYRPRHPYPGFNYQYRYRFYAPYHNTYEESYATFTTEKLEHFHWNYLDHYVCTGGDNEFGLVDSLKYWRFRILLIPLNNQATKRIIDGSQYCDIYTLPNEQEHQQMIDGILKFIETTVNKIKRTTASKKNRMSFSVVNNVPLIQPRRNSMSNFSQNSSARLNERHLVAPTLRSGSKVMDRNKSSQCTDSPTNTEQSLHESNPDEGIIPMGTCLKYTANHFEIIEAMKNPIHGLSFINGHTNLPATTFIAADAVHWLKLRMEGISTIDKAVEIINGLHGEKLIQHASGDSTKQFSYGFYLFYIIDKDIQLSCDLQVFENEWLEIEIKSALNWGLSLSTNGIDVPNKFSDRIYGVPHFLCEDINSEYAENDYGQMYKRMRLETDVAGKSDRVEWGHVQYQTIFIPDQAYELIIEWLTSSGSIIAELLSSWHRKAAQICGLQMIPIPHDPLALPYSNKSDPLRGPIFVPLNIKDLEDKHGLLFREFDESTHLDRIFLFQEAIIQRFGFINCLLEPPNNPDATSREHHYVHSTGTIFILISRSATKPRSRVPSVGSKNRSSQQRISSFHADVVPSPHEAYITRHVSGKNKDDYDNSRKLGFLWSWNHMVSRRWRTNPAVDTNFQTRLLKDFREFCANIDNRLDQFWDESWVTKENRCLDKYQKIL